MATFYVDHFRGFSKTCIPLSDVNFFVGENSTGKSSLLALIELCADNNFWISESFQTNKQDLGGFKDIVSANEPHAEEFNFGFCENLLAQNDFPETKRCVLISYKAEQGLPVCNAFGILFGNNLTCANIGGEKLKFSKKSLEDAEVNQEPRELFKLMDSAIHQDASAWPDERQLPLAMKGNLRMTMALMSQQSITEKSHPSSFLIRPRFLGEFISMAPIRTRPRRTYDGYGHSHSPEGEHTPYVLRKRLASKGKAVAFKRSLEKFGKESGLFKRVVVHEMGKETASPFELLVVLANQKLRIDNVGYGVSQVLPIIVEALDCPKKSWLSVQQPEVHLHPKAQAALGDLLFEIAEQEEKKFLIETHSDYMIDRFRTNFAENQNCKITAQVLFFERKNGYNTVTPISILKNGEYPSEQPDSFRSFFLKEQMRLLGIS